MTKLKNLRLVGLAAVVALLAGLGGYQIARQGRPAAQPATTNVAAYGDLSYPKGWVQAKTISIQEDALDIISKAERESPAASTFLRVETGNLPKDFDINDSSRSVVASLKKELAGFSLVKNAVKGTGDNASIQIEYKQYGYQYLLAIMPRPKQTYYLTVKAKDTDFVKIRQDVDAITKAVGAYATSKT